MLGFLFALRTLIGANIAGAATAVRPRDPEAREAAANAATIAAYRLIGRAMLTTGIRGDVRRFHEGRTAVVTAGPWWEPILSVPTNAGRVRGDWRWSDPAHDPTSVNGYNDDAAAVDALLAALYPDGEMACADAGRCGCCQAPTYEPRGGEWAAIDPGMVRHGARVGWLVHDRIG